MKKGTQKNAVRWISVYFAVLLFFSAALLPSLRLYWTDAPAELKPLFGPVGAVLAAASLTFCGFAVRQALREAKRPAQNVRLCGSIPPDLYLCCTLPAMLSLSVGTLVKPAKDVSGVLLLPLYTTGLFVLLLFFALLLAYSLRRGGLRCAFSYTRFCDVPFSRRTVVYFICLEAVKWASTALFLIFTDNAFKIKKEAIVPTVLFLLLDKAVLLPVLFRTLRQTRGVMERTARFVDGDLSGSAAQAGDYASLVQHGRDIDSVVRRIGESADAYVQSSNFRAELITNLSHDIKTPLTSIINYAQLLQEPDADRAERARYLEVLQRHSDRLQKLLDDLTEVSDAAAGKIEVHAKTVDLCELVPYAAAGFRERLQTRGIRLSIYPAKNPMLVTADPNLLTRVVDNLLNNICKYAKADSTVKIMFLETDLACAVCFYNEAEHVLTLPGDALKERFVRTDSARTTEGSGLGLSIAHSLMQIQGGMLRLKTEKTTFTAQILFRKE
ncbi:MAG: HAMP domain-containing histidine kinase [Clostridia bacterium]|nr:HAMP domain-containing histidine kinase [Clostridia bacterium]